MRSFNSIRKLVIAAALMLVPAASFAGVFISVNIAPPVLPVYTQPLCPGDGYLWTPGYWGWGGGAYLFHAGYWGAHVGFYGGVNYGFGYTGRGYEGGYWNHGAFAYNRSVNNINIRDVHNVYNRTVVVNNYNRVSYNGGRGGIEARANAQEEAAMREHRLSPTVSQINHRDVASQDRNQFASVNHGQPRTTAMRTVNDRAFNQQNRVANGVRSGQMTAGETRNVENREASINHQAGNDRAANNGRLTQQEHQQINQRQNNVSRSINNDKHNAARQPQARPQGGREEHR